jgi:chemotaxis-related protein WspD
MNEEKPTDHIIINELLNRTYSDGYIDEWTEIIKQGKFDELDEKLRPILIFRTHNEWLALPVKIIKDIISMKKVHTIPHRMSDILKGTVNVGGQLKLYVSISNILEITTEISESIPKSQSECMCLINLDQNDWVIKMDEILGIRRIALSSLENVPVTVSKSTANFLKGIFHIDGRNVGYIEEELLFYSLKRRACD